MKAITFTSSGLLQHVWAICSDENEVKEVFEKISSELPKIYKSNLEIVEINSQLPVDLKDFYVIYKSMDDRGHSYVKNIRIASNFPEAKIIAQEVAPFDYEDNGQASDGSIIIDYEGEVLVDQFINKVNTSLEKDINFINIYYKEEIANCNWELNFD